MWKDTGFCTVCGIFFSVFPFPEPCVGEIPCFFLLLRGAYPFRAVTAPYSVQQASLVSSWSLFERQTLSLRCFPGCSVSMTTIAGSADTEALPFSPHYVYGKKLPDWQTRSNRKKLASSVSLQLQTLAPCQINCQINR